MGEESQPQQKHLKQGKKKKVTKERKPMHQVKKQTKFEHRTKHSV